MTVLQVVVQTPVPPPPGLDPNLLIDRLIPLVGVVTLCVVAAITLRWLFQSPMAQAMAERMRARTRGRFGEGGDGDSERVAALEHQVASLQGQLAELAERVDFAERMLAERRERKLSAGQ
jgi:hypothetical protein